jgi:hypothetical protein
MTIQEVGRSKVWFCGFSLAGIAGSNPAADMGIWGLVNAVFCQVEVSATVLSPVQRNSTECGVSVLSRDLTEEA